MKKILLSVQPEWVCEILNKKKFMEARKTIPKCDLPCEIFIYCTKGKNDLRVFSEYVCKRFNIPRARLYTPSDQRGYTKFIGDESQSVNGKVVAEFTLNKVDTYDYDIDFLNTKEKKYYIKSGELEKTCLTYEELCNYGKGKTLYGWHIDDLKIYDKPKELSEFRSALFDMSICLKSKKNNRSLGFHKFNELKRPPQSWCYVEKLEKKENE